MLWCNINCIPNIKWDRISTYSFSVAYIKYTVLDYIVYLIYVYIYKKVNNWWPERRAAWILFAA